MKKQNKLIEPIVYNALTSYPFIEHDFDALTLYELISHLISKINETINLYDEQLSDENLKDIINNWIEEHPEYVTTIIDGAVTTAKIADEAVTTAKISDGAITEEKTSDYLQGVITGFRNMSKLNENLLMAYDDIVGLSGYAPQGYTINRDNDHEIFCFAVDSGTGNGYVVDTYNGNVINRYEIAAGHLNCIDWIPDTGEYIVTTSDSNPAAIVLNSEFAVNKEYTMPNGVRGTNFSRIAYDDIHKSYYAEDDLTNVYILSYDDFSVIKDFGRQEITQHIYDTIRYNYRQGACSYKGCFVRINWTAGTFASRFSASSFTIINVMDYMGNIMSEYYIPMIHRNDESEDIAIDSNGIFKINSYFSYNMYITEVGDNISVNLYDRNYVELDSEYVEGFGGKIALGRVGGVCEMKISDFVGLTGNTETTIGTVPADMIPLITAGQTCVSRAGDRYQVQINSETGNITVYNYGATLEESVTINIQMVWITKYPYSYN